MLFDCDLAQPIWKKVGKSLNYEFNKYNIITIYESRNMIPINYMIAIISYSLYMSWIEYLNKNKVNNLIDLRYPVLGQFKYRKCLYQKYQNSAIIIIIIIIIFWLKHQYLKHKYQSMVQQIIANMLSETVYTGITNLYIITKNQQNTKQYIINVNSVF